MKANKSSLKEDKNVEQSLVDAKAKLESLLNAAVDAIIVIDQKGSIESFNAAAVRMFGYQVDEVVGQNVKMLMPEPYLSQHDQFLRNYLKTGKANIIGIGREVKACKQSGEIFCIELSVGEVTGSSHKQFVGIIRDISEKIQVQNEARESRERLSHITRISTMGEMAAGIAHEINQPLTAVSAYAQACRRFIDKGADKANILPILEKINTQALRAGEVIQRLRTFVKKHSGQREVADLNILITDSVNLARGDTRLLDHGVTLQLSDDSPQVIVDNVQIQQVIINLIRNAIDAMDNNPVEKLQNKSKPVVIQSRWIDQEWIEVSVVDFGHGVDKESSMSLFNPFFTTKAAGMGMGLSISQTIINAHGGRLWHRHGDPIGSVFSFTLPVAPNTQIPETIV